MLTVVSRACQRGGTCSLPIDAIAALAGVSRSTTQNAVRLAVRLGLIERRERRIPGRKSLTNIVRVISAEWTAWLKLSAGDTGFKLISPSISHSLPIGGNVEKSVDRRGVQGRALSTRVKGTILAGRGRDQLAITGQI